MTAHNEQREAAAEAESAAKLYRTSKAAVSEVVSENKLSRSVVKRIRRRVKGFVIGSPHRSRVTRRNILIYIISNYLQTFWQTNVIVSSELRKYTPKNVDVKLEQKITPYARHLSVFFLVFVKNSYLIYEKKKNVFPTIVDVCDDGSGCL